MNFDIDDTQREIQSLASDVFTRLATVTRLEAVESSPDRFDRELWAELARTGLLGVALPESFDGLGLGMVELGLVCEQLGRAVAPVPYVATTCAGLALAEHGSDSQQQAWLPRIAAGDVVIAIAPASSADGVQVVDGSLSGEVVGVPWAHVAERVLLPLQGRLWLVDPAADGVTAARGETTARQVALDLRLDGVAAEPVGEAGAAAWLKQRWFTAWAAVQAGVTDAALRLTADYTSGREQFGKPLSTFQGVALKAADAYVDARVIAAAALQAAWALDSGIDAMLQVLTAAWWAAEGGQHCVHITQHLHGGMGADVTYPVHRYFLWGTQTELLLGGGSRLLATLGDALADRPEAGDALVLS
ncbi:MAG TPA: acyl-CoA dehydrogenase family protein [Mycobacteriales bacterium]|jgi:acyl-CoA dehydrogenase|nr:acyl-CoA dehydrogenase family protein [Mycobacteriales bacterium]